MPVLTNSLEGGTSGTTLTPLVGGNTGGASGNFFDQVSIGASATLTFDNAHAAHGGLAMKATTPVAATSSFAYWGTSLGAGQGTVWFRAYLYLTANPGVNTRAVTFWTTTSAGTICASVVLKTTGKVAFWNSGSSEILVTTASVPLNQWFRIEGFCVSSATTGQLELKLFSSMDAVTPDETQTSTALQNTGASIGSTGFGPSSSVASITYWLDDVGASTTGYLGPSVTAAAAAQQRGRPVMAAPLARVRGWLARRAGTFAGTGPAVRALDAPVRAQPARARGGIISHRAGTFAGTGPPLKPPQHPVQARVLPQRGGSVSHRAGTPAVAAPQAGPPAYPLQHPVAARRLPQRGGDTSSRAGTYGGTGPAVRPPDGPVRAQPPPQRGGRTASRAGTFTAVSLTSGPPVYPLGHPVQARRQPVRGGSAIHRAGTFAGTGPPVPALKQPLGVYRRQPSPPARGRVLSLDGIRQGSGAPVRALDGPVRGQPQKPVLSGRAASRAGVAVFVPPPVLQNAASSPTVTAADTSAASATGAVHGASVTAQGTSAASATGQPGASTVIQAGSSGPSVSDG